MANIPVKEGPGVATRPIGTPYLQLDTTGAFGAGVAQGLGELGQGVQQGLDAVGKAVQKARDEAEATATTEALTKLKGYGTQAYYDAKTGFVTLQGKAALEASGKTLQSFEDFSKKLEEGLPSDRARKAFRAHAAVEGQQFYAQVESHAGREHERYQDETFQGNMKASLDAVAANPARLELEISASQKPLEAYNLIKGGGEEGLRAKQASLAQSFTATALDSLITRSTNDPAAAAQAREIFRLHANDLGTKRDEYEARLQIAGLKAEAQSLTSNIRNAAMPGRRPDGTVDDSVPPWLDHQQMRTAVRGIPDSKPELKAMVGQLVDHQIAEDLAARETKAKEVAAVAWAAFNDKKTLAAIPADTQRYLNDPRNGPTAVQEWRELLRAARGEGDYWRARKESQQDTPEQSDAVASFVQAMKGDVETFRDMPAADLRRWAREAGVSEKSLHAVSQAQLQLSGLETTDEKEARRSIHQRMSSAPGDFEDMNVDKFQALAKSAGVSDRGLEELTDRLNVLQAGQGKRDPNRPLPKSVYDDVSRELQKRGIGVKKRGQNPADVKALGDDVTVADVTDEATAELTKWRNGMGKDATPEQYEKKVAEVTRDVVLHKKGLVYGTNDVRTVAAAAQRAGAEYGTGVDQYLDVMAPKDLAQVDQALDEQKKPKTEANRRYVYELGRGRAWPKPDGWDEKPSEPGVLDALHPTEVLKKAKGLVGSFQEYRQKRLQEQERWLKEHGRQ